MDQSVVKNKRFNKKKICSALMNVSSLDNEKRNQFENMKHDFAAHLSDRLSDRFGRKTMVLAVITEAFQSLRMQIPSQIQNLTIGQIRKSGGSFQLTSKAIELRIPKSLFSSNNDLSSVLPQNKRNYTFKEPSLQRAVVLKSGTTKKTTEKQMSTRVRTRSALKNDVKPNNKTIEVPKGPVFSPNTDEQTKQEKENEKQEMKETEQKILKSLSEMNLLKAPRSPKPDEPIFVLSFSSSGTPLLVEHKAIERVNKSN